MLTFGLVHPALIKICKILLNILCLGLILTDDTNLKNG